MKTLFIEAKKRHFENTELDFSCIPQKVGLLYTIQFEQIAKKIKTELEKQGKKVILGGQITGCNFSSALKIEKNIDCFLLISSGKFHPLSLALNVNKPIYIIINNKLEKIDSQHIKKKRKAAISKFLLADKIGIIISTKPRQFKLKKAILLKNKLKEKKVFLFISDTIDKKELENFQIDAWLNTACPGLIFDISNMINLSEYKNLNKSIEKLK
ncbi:MAG: diphthamide synthesis protein [Candidatus Pacearchaeota archaeon]